jgi:hypothetical protein
MDSSKQYAINELQKMYPTIEVYVWNTLISFGWTKTVAKLVAAMERSWPEIPECERLNVANIIYNS